MNSSKTDLAQKAIAARHFAYSPYSTKKIGAALILSNGKIYSGCNIENASYGGTVCAERVAIWKAFSENLSQEKVVEIVVASEEEKPWPPCGFCRQVLAEFSTAETIVRLVNTKGVEKTFTLGQLLPEAFTPAHLSK